jgi:23S rRNA pseudouridine1911/1915/1917 synthase
MDGRIVTFRYDEDAPIRLDLFLVSRLQEYSRSQLQAFIRNGNVLVEDEIPRKTGFSLERGMNIEVRIPPMKASDLVPEPIPLDIIFENEDVLLINKTAGMVVHPAAGHSTGTLVHAALAHAPQMKGVGGVKRPGVIHRLDKDTSGLIILAKNDRAHRWIQLQFKDRQVKKTYLALVDGKPPTPQGKIDAAIGRDPTHRRKMTVKQPDKGREAISRYSTIENFIDHTYLEVHPLTGRTHQIRVHMNFIGCPITGDQVYGRKKPSLSITRQFLHASRLGLVLPREAIIRTFEADLPDELKETLDTLRLVSKKPSNEV